MGKASKSSASPPRKSASSKPAKGPGPGKGADKAGEKRDPGEKLRDSEEKAELAEVVSEAGDQVDPPPPEVIEPDAQMSPEEAEQARKDYLLTRFWISARGYWGRKGDRLAWLFTIGLLLLIVGHVGFQY